ncbi:hypothetical protein PIROE2DRAFT_68591 [Piromyces sp. E2]|nr:hypothetical protein PIROE2DRAFT_68591 [Piromyces sp. E2]|eukprot:OUM69211.1 hypothetical protein PIROE2DRAFT_68591 [Piromyces sp. E2]
MNIQPSDCCEFFFGDYEASVGASGGMGGPPSNVTTTGGVGGPPSNVTTTGGMGGPPSGVTTTGGMGGPPSKAFICLNYIGKEMPVVGKVDACFKPKAALEFPILALTVIYFVPSIILYYKYRKHLLIKYRQPKIVLWAAIIGALMNILIPVSINE